MRISQINALLFLISVSILTSCNHYDSIQKSGRESGTGEKSHNAGQDCMSCHHSINNEASGEGNWWYIAGTAYNKNGTIATSGKVEFWSTSDISTAKLVCTLTIDREGNFYTSKIIDFKSGLYPKMISANGDTSMSSAVTFTNASCNSCHGNNADGRNQSHVKFK